MVVVDPACNLVLFRRECPSSGGSPRRLAGPTVFRPVGEQRIPLPLLLCSSFYLSLCIRTGREMWSKYLLMMDSELRGRQVICGVI